MISNLNKLLDYLALDNNRSLRKEIIKLINTTKEYDYGNGYLYQSFENIPLRGLRNSKFRINQLKINDYIKNKSILDIGCNTGFVSMSLNDDYKKIFSIDHNYTAIKIANLVKNYINKKNIDFIHDDFNSYNFLEKFDIILSLANHSTEDKGITNTFIYFEKINMLLNYNGILFIESHHPQIESPNKFSDIMYYLINKYKYETLFKSKYKTFNFYDNGRSFYVLKKIFNKSIC